MLSSINVEQCLLENMEEAGLYDIAISISVSFS